MQEEAKDGEEDEEEKEKEKEEKEERDHEDGGGQGINRSGDMPLHLNVDLASEFHPALSSNLAYSTNSRLRSLRHRRKAWPKSSPMARRRLT